MAVGCGPDAVSWIELADCVPVITGVEFIPCPVGLASTSETGMPELELGVIVGIPRLGPRGRFHLERMASAMPAPPRMIIIRMIAIILCLRMFPFSYSILLLILHPNIR